jgi:hypothetical protein
VTFSFGNVAYKWRAFHSNDLSWQTLPVTACYFRKLSVLPVCNANIYVPRKFTTSLFLFPTLISGVNIKEILRGEAQIQQQRHLAPK